MLEKKIVGVVVGSNDPEAHQKSFQEGEQVAKLIDDFGEFEACLIEIGKGPWLLHYDDSKATFDKEKFGTIIRRRRVKPDSVLILTKGKVGETGELQEYFDKMGVPSQDLEWRIRDKPLTNLNVTKYSKVRVFPPLAHISSTTASLLLRIFLIRLRKCLDFLA
eukprot:TRINITY_DN7585_c0_g1_i2.p1 TRINITY_DN7585_c0_g1~~TRINITY_DN7585_c0_g1_i2.p1  ORF type:complete len:163 (-),score=37.32 TRINITY_DN7585_c0_g1_i2:86-574(-)